MIDSGASHNFISPEVVRRLRLSVCAGQTLEVLLGNGVVIKAEGVCKDVAFQLNATTFHSEFIALELGSVDVILGVQWIETLGKCEVDWKLQEFSFIYGGNRVKIIGDPTLHCRKFSLKSLSPVYGGSVGCSKVMLTSAVLQPVECAVDPRVLALLDRFGDVFAVPVALPPIRSQEHAINLVSGVSAISVHPYRYPHARKVVMEKMVQEMLEVGIIRPSVSPSSGVIG